MRILLFSIVVCLTWPVFAENELADCADIESNLARLDCYDALAREQASQSDTAKPEPPEAAPVPPGEPAAEPARTLVEQPPSSQDDSNQPVEADAALFGKEKQIRPVLNVDHIDARIESISKTPLGHHIMTLSNGQVWVENEPGRRRIEPDQDVTIRKHRWHYEMELKSRPNVAVRRVE